MTAFQEHSKSFLRDLSRVAEWMMRRNVGPNHWWRWPVLTAANNDTDPPPKFSDEMAIRMFQELERRNLIIAIKDANGNPVDVDGTRQLAFLMNYNQEGWEKAVADGRPMRGLLRKVKQSWHLMLATLLLGIVGTALKDEATGLVKKGIESVAGKSGEQKPAPQGDSE
jgi:hypothetical protein